MIHDVFPTLKSLYMRVSNEEGGARVSLAIVIPRIACGRDTVVVVLVS